MSSPIESQQQELPEFIEIQAFSPSSSRETLFIVLCIFSFGLLPVLCHWYPQLYTWIRRQNASLSAGEYVLVKGLDRSFTEIPVFDVQSFGNWNEQSQLLSETDPHANTRFFDYRKQRYVYREAIGAFIRQSGRLKGKLSDIHAHSSGLSQEQAYALLRRYGFNTLDVDLPPLARMIFEKVLHPFYIFQLASVFIWIYTNYVTFSLVILISSMASIAHEIHLARSSISDLQKLIPPADPIIAIRGGKPQKIQAADVVVGDLVQLQPSSNVACDLALIQGECVTDESTLTGESIPIVKTVLPNDTTDFAIDRYKSHILFAGSRLLQVKPGRGKAAKTKFDGALAIVLSTGFSTTKGELFRSLVFPKKINFKFYKDAYKFLAILGGVALIAFINRAIDGFKSHSHIVDVLLSSADLITIAVPPALPLVLTVGIVLSVQRLKKLRIFCISPERINFAGRLDTMCWDKTGTLTSTSLIFSGTDFIQDGALSGLESINLSRDMEIAIAACHSVNLVRSTAVGHPIDVEMMIASGWNIDQSDDKIEILGQVLPLVAIMKHARMTSQDIFVVSRFDFDSLLQRSSVQVVTSLVDDSHLVISKGSAESILSICRPESIPANYHFVHKKYALEGYYVLACGMKRCLGLQIGTLRKDVEKDLEFVGFILFRNKLKPETIPTIRALQAADIRSIIITGDNAMNAIHVSREIGIMRECILVEKTDGGISTFRVPLESTLEASDEASDVRHKPLQTIDDIVTEFMGLPSTARIAITGEALNLFENQASIELLNWLIDRTTVFSRAKPNQKSWIIEHLISMNKIVGMCGDGTNDCGALKAAHVGVGLSDAEASIVAPFTSCKKQVTDIVKLLEEGRCALETSFTAFKFMALYPIIQLMMASTLYQYGSSMSNNQYLFDDLCIVLFLGIFMCWTEPARGLSVVRPPDDLFSPLVLSSILGQVLISIAFFGIVLAVMSGQAWYCSVEDVKTHFSSDFKPLPETGTPCYTFDPAHDIFNGNIAKTHENTVIWLYTHFQFVWVAIAFTITHHFRLPFWTNIPYTTFLNIIVVTLVIFLLLGDNFSGFGTFSWIFTIQKGVPELFRLALLLLSVVNLMIALACEYILVDHIIRRWDNRKQRVNKYVRESLLNDSVGIPGQSPTDRSRFLEQGDIELGGF